MTTQLPQLEGFSLHVTVYIDPSNVSKFFEAMTPVYNLVTAEPECLFFEIYQDPNNPGTISWVENWSKSPEWMMAHQITKEYYKPYFAATEPLFVKEREFRILQRVEGFVMAREGNFGEGGVRDD